MPEHLRVLGTKENQLEHSLLGGQKVDLGPKVLGPAAAASDRWAALEQVPAKDEVKIWQPRRKPRLPTWCRAFSPSDLARIAHAVKKESCSQDAQRKDRSGEKLNSEPGGCRHGRKMESS